MPAELHPITVNGPWHRIGIDYIGPLPITAACMNYKFVCFLLKYLDVLLLIGDVYIVTCSDYFTCGLKHVLFLTSLKFL